MQHQPPGTFSFLEHVSRSAASLVAPLLLYVVYWFLLFVLGFAERRDAKQLKKLADAKKKMIKELKVLACLSSTMTLLGVDASMLPCFHKPSEAACTFVLPPA